MKRLKLSFPANGEAAIAELLEEEAPEVCAYIMSLLPLEGKAIHGMYSGAEVFQMIDDPQPAAPENLVSLPLPGELLYFYDAGSNAVGRKGAVGEVCLVYGRGVSLKAHEGMPTRASL